MTNSLRTLHMSRYRRFVPGMLVLALFLGLLGVLVTTSDLVTAYVLALVLAGYFYPLWAKDVTRHIPLFKNLYVSIVYPLLVIIPLRSWDRTSNSLTFLVTFSFLIFFDSFICQMVLDTKDEPSDRAHGLKTCSVIYGVENTLHIASLMNLIVGSACLVLATRYGFPFSFFLLILASMLVKQAIIILIHKHRAVGYLISAGMFLWWVASFALIRSISVCPSCPFKP